MISFHPPHKRHIEAKANGRHFRDDISKSIFLNENVRILIEISLKFVPNCQYSSIGSDDGLVPTRPQAIIQTNDG